MILMEECPRCGLDFVKGHKCKHGRHCSVVIDFRTPDKKSWPQCLQCRCELVKKMRKGMK